VSELHSDIKHKNTEDITSKDDTHSKLLSELLNKVSAVQSDIKHKNNEDMIANIDQINRDITINEKKLSEINKNKLDLQNRNNNIKEEIIKQQNDSDLLSKL